MEWARLLSQFDQLDTIIAEGKNNASKLDKALQYVARGEAAMASGLSDSARGFFDKALEIAPTCHDALANVAFLQISSYGVHFDDEGFMIPPLHDVTLNMSKMACTYLEKIDFNAFSGIDIPVVSPCQWNRVVESMLVYGHLLEQKQQYEASSKLYNDVWNLFISPNLEIVFSLELDKDLESRSRRLHMIRRASSLGLASIAGQCRMFLHLRDTQHFLELFRSLCTDPQLSNYAPSLRWGCFFRFAQMLVIHNQSVANAYTNKQSSVGALDYANSNIYTPSSPIEEAIVLLRIILFQQDFILDDAHISLRHRTQRTLRLALTVSSHFREVSDMQCEMLSTTTSSSKSWYLLALSFFADGCDSDAKRAIERSLEDEPNNIAAILFAAKINLNCMSNASLAMQFAVRAATLCECRLDAQVSKTASAAAHNDSSNEKNKENETTKTNDLKPEKPEHIKLQALHCTYAVGVACSRFAYETWNFSKRKKLQQRALFCLGQVVKSEPRRRDAVFYLAALHADIREIDTALRLARYALKLDSYNVHSWQLLALLLSSKKDYTKALKACDTGLMDCAKVDTPLLLLLKARISMEYSMDATAHRTSALKRKIQNTLKMFNTLLITLFNTAVLTTVVGEWSFPYIDRSVSLDTYEIKSDTIGQHELRAYCSTTLKRDDPEWIKYETLLSLTRVFSFILHHFNIIEVSRLAFDCIDCARDIGSSLWLPDIYTELALLCEQSNDLESAISHYETALSFDANHTETLTRIGSAQRRINKNQLEVAHEYLVAALNIDSTLHQTWFEMGLVFQQQNNHTQACDALLTALELERTAPAMSFEIIPRRL